MSHQRLRKLNVWVGLIDNSIIGSGIRIENLTGISYYEMSERYNFTKI